MPGKQWSSRPPSREHRPRGTPSNGTRPRMGVRGLKGEGGLVGSPFPWDGPGRETRAQGEGGVRSAGCEAARCFLLRRSFLATSYRILTFLCSVNLSKLESLLKLTILDLCTTLKSVRLPLGYPARRCSSCLTTSTSAGSQSTSHRWATSSQAMFSWTRSSMVPATILPVKHSMERWKVS